MTQAPVRAAVRKNKVDGWRKHGIAFRSLGGCFHGRIWVVPKCAFTSLPAGQSQQLHGQGTVLPSIFGWPERFAAVSLLLRDATVWRWESTSKLPILSQITKNR